jgi:Fe-S-cluster formation regulator IscX/YfhJ
MKWHHEDQIAQALHKKHFEKDVLIEDIVKMDLSDLHYIIIHLDEFEGNPELEDYIKLRSILERWKERIQSILR